MRLKQFEVAILQPSARGCHAVQRKPTTRHFHWSNPPNGPLVNLNLDQEECGKNGT